MEIVDMKIIAQSNANIYQYGNADFVKYQKYIGEVFVKNLQKQLYITDL